MGVGPITSRAVFLDRDGVINRAVVIDGTPHPPAGVDELEIEPGARAALQRLKDRGFLLVVVTNQPDVGRGTQRIEEVAAIHDALRAALPVDGFYTCYHARDGECTCRKPAPGLLERAQAEHGIDLGTSYLIGDRWRDIDAAKGAGVHAVLIDRGYRERGPAHAPDATVQSLAAAVEWILADSAIPSLSLRP